MDIIVKAKVLRLEEDELAKLDSKDPLENEFVWGNMALPVEEIRFYWNQSKNRCVIELHKGRMILVAITFDELKSQIELKREELRNQQAEEAESDEEDLILGEEEPYEDDNSEED